jgi:hypothetical protein
MRVSFWAGPGAGKSATAEGVSHALKKRGFNVDLVQEWIKGWAYQKRVPVSFEPSLIFAQQLHLEDFLLNRGVDHVVTDSPVLMNVAYCKLYGSPGWEHLARLGLLFEEKYPAVHVFLDREGIPYEQNGRYEDYGLALERDRTIRSFMEECGLNYAVIPTIDFDRIIRHVLDAVATEEAARGRKDS